MIKFKLYLDKDKETKWLNDMCNQGYAMTKFCAGFYTFEKCEPGKYIYQIDMRDTFFHVTDDYKSFMAETDVEVVQSWGYWVILRKEASKGSFELYTDVESKLEHYTKILKMFKLVTILEIICFIVEAIYASQGVTEGIIFMFIIAMLIIGLMKAIIKTKSTISKLKEENGTASTDNIKVSNVLLWGLWLNLLVILIPDSVSQIYQCGLQIFAIIVMLIGLYNSRDVFKK